MDPKRKLKSGPPQITMVKRPKPPITHKVVPSIEDDRYETMSNGHMTEDQLQFSPREHPHQDPTSKSVKSKSTFESTNNRAATPDFIELFSAKTTATDMTNPKNNSNVIQPPYTDSTSGKKKTILTIIIVAVILLCIIAVILIPILLLIVFKSSESTTTISTSSTTAAPIISILWTFDNTNSDNYDVYNGTLMNGATYLPPSTTQPYLANGYALILVAGSSQSFIVNSPQLNLAYTSFTVEAWVYPATLGTDRGVFSQCQCSTCVNQCLYMIIRSNKLYMGFTSNDIAGSTLLTTNNWQHVAYVYDYENSQQRLYLNGVQDAIKSSALPYIGVNGSTEIGAAQVFLTKYYFNGYIDQVSVVTRAKSSTEILRDATLIAYYSFDLPAPNSDFGSYSFNGSSSNSVITSGRVNQAMRFSGASSYFQAYGFYQMDYSMTTGKSFSISFWMNPSSLVSCAILQVAKVQSTNQCYNIIGIYSPTGTTGQLLIRFASGPSFYGPFLTTNTWTHVSVTYSSTNGMTLYMNGVTYGSSGAFVDSPSNVISTIVIGYNIACALCCQVISNAAYQGSIDELYFHSRELSQSDVQALANP